MSNGEPMPPDLMALEQTEKRRSNALGRAMCATVTFIAVLFAIKDAILGNTHIALILCAFASSNMIALAVYSRYEELQGLGYFLLFSCGSLCIYLVATGGTDNSGILWMASYPVLMFSILRVKIAAIAVFGLLLTVVCILYWPNHVFYSASYNNYTKLAGIGSYLLITAFTLYQGRSREVSAIAVARLNHELNYIASTDELTSLPNRRDMSLRLDFECRRSKRTGEEFSVILCDIDYFKKINDSFGHSVGDQALQAFSKLLQSRFRDTDKVGRWGGEEFLAILPNTGIEEATALADQVRRCICQASLFPNMPNRLVTMSGGVASSAESSDATELVILADQHLYEAKNGGRNCIRPKPKN